MISNLRQTANIATLTYPASPALDPGACHVFTIPTRPPAPACRNALINVRYTLVHRNEDNNNIVAAYADLANKP